ncbi:MAG: hypothetical protein U1A78_16810 [Polyangia bacterium]
MFSTGFENVLHALRRKPYQFPANWAPDARRVGESGGQNLISWLREQIRGELRHRGLQAPSLEDEFALLQQCAVEPNLGVFAQLDCDEADKNRIVYASIQVLIARTKSLDDLYRSGTGELTYVRLDYEPKGRLEELFKTPLPHIHVEPHGEPRIPLDSMTSGNLVLDFFDWVYRTYLHPTWRDWAKQTFDQEMSRRRVANNPWEPIEAAFVGKGKLPILRKTFSRELEWMKKALRAKKDDAFPLRVTQSDCDLVAYR